jgi:outer membrane protein assembly factor BamA
MVKRVLPGVILAILVFAGTAFSQKTPGSPDTVLNETDVLSHEGQVVSQVELTGRPDLDIEHYRRLIRVQPGERLSTANIVEAIDALRNTHQFNDVQVDLKPEPDGVRVAFVLQPALYVGLYQFPGAERFSYGLLIQISRFSAQEPYSPLDTKRAQESLLMYFRQNGYFQSRVEAVVRPDKLNGLVNVDFKTTLGLRARFGNVLTEGVTPGEASRIQRFLRSFRARLRMAAVRPGGTYSQTRLQNATRQLESRLADDAGPIVQIKVSSANYNPQTNRADVTFTVNRGAVIHAHVEGAKLPSRVVRRLLSADQEGGLSPEVIQDGKQNLLKHFRQRGYFEAKVSATVEGEDGEKTVVYKVSQGPRERIKDIEFRGNTHFSHHELEQYLNARKGNFLNRGRYDEASVGQLRAFYQSQGFNEVEITPKFVRAEGTDVTLVFVVNEGPQDIVEDLQIEGNTVPIVKLAPAGLRVRPGRPFSQSAMAEDKSQLVSSYLDLGYLTASLNQTSQAVSWDAHRFHVLYDITEGPQVKTGSVVTLGRSRTEQALIDRDVAHIQPGIPIRQSELFASESRLFARGVFDWSQVNLRRPIASQDQEDVIVKVHEAKRNNILYGFGFQMTNRAGNIPSGRVTVPGLPPLQLPSTFVTNEDTIAGPRANFQYTRSNVRGRAETVTFGALYGPLERTAEFDFINPHFRWTNWRAVIEAAADYNKENPIFISRQVLGTVQFEHPLDKKQQQSLTLRYSLSRLNLTDLEIPELVPPRDRNTRLSTLSAAYIRDARDSLVDTHKGTYVSFEVDENPRIFGANTTFTRLLAQGAYYRQLTPDWIWANSVRAGLLVPTKGEAIPISQRFFTGGGSTLRGFPLNGAGPQTAVPACSNPSDSSTCSLIDVPVGGVQLLIINSELRMPLPLKKGLRVVAFYDGGNVFDPESSTHSFNLSYTNSVGLGFRYSTPVGPIRVDVGRNLNPVPGMKPTQLFITLGQAF